MMATRDAYSAWPGMPDMTAASPRLCAVSVQRLSQRCASVIARVAGELWQTWSLGQERACRQCLSEPAPALRRLLEAGSPPESRRLPELRAQAIQGRQPELSVACVHGDTPFRQETHHSCIHRPWAGPTDQTSALYGLKEMQSTVCKAQAHLLQQSDFGA